jgi:hypothetical protein
MVSPRANRNSYCRCTGWKAWKVGNDSESGRCEINITAEYLNRPFEETAGTLLHEMVHLANLQNGIKYTSRGGTYHNKEFKLAAEAHGLTVSKTKSGWHVTALTGESLEWLRAQFPDDCGFELHRERAPELSKSGRIKSSKKYVCPCCGTVIRATKEVNVTCSDCDEPFDITT